MVSVHWSDCVVSDWDDSNGPEDHVFADENSPAENQIGDHNGQAQAFQYHIIVVLSKFNIGYLLAI